ncbi:MAG: DUF4280 domain-containing protein [Caldilineaceae bacterium]
MPQQVYHGAMIQCSFGAAPGVLTVTPEKMVDTSGIPAATIMDFVPMKNIMPFAMCMTLSNPVVAAATAAKLGVFTPAPCVPAIASPWTPGSAVVQIRNQPALNNTCTCMCQWGGVITIVNPGQMKVSIP